MAKAKANKAPEASNAESQEIPENQEMEQTGVDTTSEEQGEPEEQEESTITKEEEVEDTPEETVESPKPKFIQKVIPPKPAEKIVEAVSTLKKVQIMLTENLDCYVGQDHYTGRKDTAISVPSDVAAIVVNGKKGYRI